MSNHPDTLADKIAAISGNLDAEIYWFCYGFILNAAKHLSEKSRLEKLEELDALFLEND